MTDPNMRGLMVDDLQRGRRPLGSLGGVAEFSTDANGNTVLLGPDGDSLQISLFENISTESIQAALDGFGRVRIAPGEYIADETILLSANQSIQIDSATLTQTSKSRPLVTIGNCAFTGATIALSGVFLICADTQIGGSGSIAYVAATKIVTWTAPGDTAGSGVDVTTGGKFTLTSGTAGKALHIRVAAASLPAGNVTQAVKITAKKGATSATLSRVSAITTVTETAHGRQAGDMVTLLADVNFDGLFKIARITDADHYVLNDGRADNTSSTTRVFGVRNVSFTGVNGAKLRSINAVGSGNMLSNMCQFHSVSQWEFGGFDASMTSGKYVVFTTGVSDYTILPMHFSDTVADGVHIGPGSYGGVLHRVSGKCGDNMVGIGPTDYIHQLVYSPAETGDLDVDGLYVEDIYANDTYLEALRVHGASNRWVKNVTVESIRGTVNSASSACIGFIYDASTVNGAYVNFKNIRLSNIDIGYSDLTTNKATVIIIPGTSSSVVDGIVIDGICINNDPATSGGVVHVGEPISGTLEVNGVTVKNSGVLDGFLVAVSTSAAVAGSIGSLKVRRVNAKFINTINIGGVVRVANAANVIKNLLIEDIEIEDTSSAGTKARVLWNSGLAPSRVKMEKIITTACDAITTISNTSSAGGHFVYRDINIVSGFTYIHSQDKAAASVMYDTIQATSGHMLNNGATTGTTVLRAANINHTGTHLNGLASGCNFELHGIELKADIALANVQKVEGASCYNTNSAAGSVLQAGVVLCQKNAAGTLVWTNPATAGVY